MQRLRGKQRQPTGSRGSGTCDFSQLVFRKGNLRDRWNNSQTTKRRVMSVSPGVINPDERQTKIIWTEIRNVLLEVFARNILTSGIIRSADVLKALKGKFLDKGARKLMRSLSILPGKTVDPVIESPRCFRLRLVSCLAELENDPCKNFYKIQKTAQSSVTIQIQGIHPMSSLPK